MLTWHILSASHQPYPLIRMSSLLACPTSHPKDDAGAFEYKYQGMQVEETPEV